MRRRVILIASLTLVAVLVATFAFLAKADEPTEEDIERWTEEYMKVKDEGRELWGSPELGTNGVSCGQCHPNAANTHPETYPKFQQQLGEVVELRTMINWCIQNPLEGEHLELDSEEMIALEAYIAWERRGVELAPGKH
ncbi:MAG: cytochrome C [Armatimonadia bacterium]|jgi:thiosulfate dehydrogenase|nr:cytochrome C [Armatimonadia bacterium]